MGVFLRWGVFGIVAVAALLYAYNASKRMAERRQSQAEAPAAVTEGAEATEEEDLEPGNREVIRSDPLPEEMPEICDEERQVAERALKMRRDGEPLDRLLRIQIIAFQKEAGRRERLETVARQWYEREGRDPGAAALRAQVLRDCQRAGPAS